MSEQNTHNNNVGAARELPKDSFPFDRIHSKVYNSISSSTEPLLYSMLKLGGYFFCGVENQDEK